MNKLLAIITLIGLSMTNIAQYELSSFTSTGRGGATAFVTDYQAVGINPANLGWQSEFDNKKITFGLSELSISLHSDALSKPELRQEFKDMMNNKTTATWTLDEKKQAAKDFTDKGIAMNADIGTFGFSFATEKLGGIAFRINDNFNIYTRLNEQVSDLIFTGRKSTYFDSLMIIDTNAILGTIDTSIIANYDIQDPDSLASIARGFTSAPQLMGQLLNGSKVQMSWTREYNISYGRKVFGIDDEIEIFAGIGLKYIQGFAMMDVRSENGKLTAFSAVTPFFDIKLGDSTTQNPSEVLQTGKLPNSVGKGFGMDLGLDLLIKNKLKIAFAVTNIGSMKWSGNVYSMQDTLVLFTNSTGINNYNVLGSMSELSANDGLFKWNGQKELVQKLPTNFRFGASIVLGENQFAQLGVDVIAPLQKDVPASLQKAMIGFGGDIKPIPWFRFSAGFVTGGNYKFSIPVGITLIAKNGTWEGGIASRDAVTFFTQNGPTLSLSTGFMRFRF